MIQPSEFPAPDLDLSPVTGWTRAHWLATAERWLEPIVENSAGEGALPRLPGRVTRDGVRREGMEAVGRSFLLAAPRMAASHDAYSDRLREHYARALLAGTRPGGSESWPMGVTCVTPLMGVTNSIVEAANIAFSLHVSGETLWNGLTRPEKRQIADWLRHHARLNVWHNNWQLFPAMAEGFLRSVGEDTSGCHGSRNVARVESWYVGDGWYTDGPERAFDYYNAWAIHPYLWAWYRMIGEEAGPEAERHRDRLSRFVTSWSDMIASDGAPVHVGRSLTYRTAMLAALWCAEADGVNPLSPGRTRQMASSVVKHFVDRGVGIDEPLSLGWHRPFEGTCQAYSGFGSPFLAGIGFLGLALPESAPVWSAREPGKDALNDEAQGEAQRSRGRDGSERNRERSAEAGTVRVLPDIDWTICRQEDGIVRLVNHGSDHCGLSVGDGPDPDDPHYAKFAYSSHTAPGTGQAFIENVDGHFALLDEDGRASRRCAIRGSHTEGRISGSVHVPQRDGKGVPGSAVTTVSFLGGEDGRYEVRVHLVRAAAGQRVREGGFAVAAGEPEHLHVVSHGARASTSASPSSDRTGPERPVEAIRSSVVGLYGWQAADTVTYTDTDAIARHSAVPAVYGTCQNDRSVFAALHVLQRVPVVDESGPVDAGHPERGRSSLDLDDVVTVNVDDTVVSVFWADGKRQCVDVETLVPWDGQMICAAG